MLEEIDIVNFMIIELEKSDKEIHQQIKKYLMDNKSICNQALYNNVRYKESTIILTNIFKNLICGLSREIIEQMEKNKILLSIKKDLEEIRNEQLC